VVATRRLIELISATLPRLQFPEGPAVIALSGGADSATLALLALEAGMEASALHVDHHLPASPMMEKAAVLVAEGLGIPIEVRRVVPARGPSPEEQARDARYEAFADVDGPVLTGHTRDDDVETVMMNLIRGSGATGLRGIPVYRPPHIHRPMLSVGRNETREIAMLAGLPFADDPMNSDLSLTRNRIRIEILPLMRALNPRVDEAISRAAGALGRDSGYLDEMAASLYQDPVPVSLLSTVPRVLADRMLRRLLEESGVGATSDRMERVWSVVVGATDRQDLTQGKVVVRRGPLVVIETGDG
jgi:tRNA(Ile)-lysidine synthase